MEHFPNDLLLEFAKGKHVMRHNQGVYGLWLVIWPDMFTELTFIRRLGDDPGHVVDRRSPVFVDYGSGRGIKAESGRVEITPLEHHAGKTTHPLRCPPLFEHNAARL